MNESPVFLATAKVRFGQEAAFSAWQTRHNRAIADFPGFQSSDIIPGGAAGSNEWTIVVNFQTPDQLRFWQHSPERAELVAESTSFLDDAILRRKSSLDAGLEPEAGSAGEPGTPDCPATAFPGWISLDPVTGKVPPNWKMSLLVLLPLFPTVVIERDFLSPKMESFPLNSVAAVFGGLAVAVLLIGGIAMPLLVRGFKWWLFPKQDAPLICLKGIAILGLLYAIEGAVLWRLLR